MYENKFSFCKLNVQMVNLDINLNQWKKIHRENSGRKKLVEFLR